MIDINTLHRDLAMQLTICQDHATDPRNAPQRFGIDPSDMRAVARYWTHRAEALSWVLDQIDRSVAAGRCEMPVFARPPMATNAAQVATEDALSPQEIRVLRSMISERMASPAEREVVKDRDPFCPGCHRRVEECYGKPCAWRQGECADNVLSDRAVRPCS